MFYEFATNLTLAETREVVREHNEALGVQAFIEADREEFVVFNYLITFPGMWKSFNGDPVNDRKAAILRECRGLTFYKDTGELAILKLNKFYNCGENDESQPHLIDWTQPHSILSKADGSMMSAYFRRDGSFELHTKMGFTDVAKPVNEFASRHPKYEEFCRACMIKGCNPIFEWTSRKQKIVIDYPEDDLILLAVRDRSTGRYHSYAEMLEYGAQYNITVIPRLEGSVTDPQAFLDQVRVLEGEEGYVIRFDNGYQTKMKAAEYLRLHHLVDMLQREKDVLALILSDSLDDYLPTMDDDMRKRLGEYTEAVERGIAAFAGKIASYTAEAIAAVGQDKKRLAMEWVNIPTVEQSHRQFIFRVAAGADSIETVKEHLIKKFIMWGRDVDGNADGTWQNIGTAGKVDEIRDIIGGIRWDDYRDTSVVIED